MAVVREKPPSCQMKRILNMLAGILKDFVCHKSGEEWRQREGERGFEADTSHRLLAQITPFSHRISHSFPNELNGLRAESHLFKPDEVGQKIDLPGGLICAHAKLDRCYVHFFILSHFTAQGAGVTVVLCHRERYFLLYRRTISQNHVKILKDSDSLVLNIESSLTAL